MTVPIWQATIELCRRAARLFPGVRSIGWDLVVSPDGPVLLEANENWDLIMVQVHTDGLLAQPGMRDDLTAYGLSVPDRVPSFAGVVIQMLKRRLRKLGEALQRPS